MNKKHLKKLAQQVAETAPATAQDDRLDKLLAQLSLADKIAISEALLAVDPVGSRQVGAWISEPIPWPAVLAALAPEVRQRVEQSMEAARVE